MISSRLIQNSSTSLLKFVRDSKIMSQSTLFNKLKNQSGQSPSISNNSNKFIKTTTTTTNNSTSSTTTKNQNTLVNNNNNGTKKPMQPSIKISQCAEALAGNRYYTTNPGYSSQSKQYVGPPATLNEVVKLEKLMKEDVKTIKDLWIQYHSVKDCICAVIPAATYRKMIDRAKQNPLFVFPLPGDKGYISILYQNQGDHFVYTYLEQYKKYSVNAVPWLTATHYTDLIDSKGIVLMRADPNFEVLNSIQANYLYQQTQMYLLDDSKYQHLQLFNHHPQKFSFDVVIKDMEALSLADKKTKTDDKTTTTTTTTTTTNEIDMTKNVIEFKELSKEETDNIEKQNQEINDKSFTKSDITSTTDSGDRIKQYEISKFSNVLSLLFLYPFLNRLVTMDSNKRNPKVLSKEKITKTKIEKSFKNVKSKLFKLSEPKKIESIETNVSLVDINLLKHDIIQRRHHIDQMFIQFQLLNEIKSYNQNNPTFTTNSSITTTTYVNFSSIPLYDTQQLIIAYQNS
ncbi:hypothetical protein DLAC_05551 [Tieghemostelium lacteum]|uniref:ATP synthase mitochondrial F1 complex assembly factor 1 n=1 Tax=Tieghemostelium lacteum TaxID=361077 RepID=A0A151ZG52_TIELA|nr:hypothetical protein DLAC_05551 [Tieghemostelium lacteum]|eukprot:KYQ92951.1 hypothetical protein DLAC_05551 [Tieghemostelium lacteum]